MPEETQKPIVTVNEYNEAVADLINIGLRLEKLKIPYLFQLTVVAEIQGEDKKTLVSPSGAPLGEGEVTLATRTLTNVNDFPTGHLQNFVIQFDERIKTILASRAKREEETKKVESA